MGEEVTENRRAADKRVRGGTIDREIPRAAKLRIVQTAMDISTALAHTNAATTMIKCGEIREDEQREEREDQAKAEAPTPAPDALPPVVHTLTGDIRAHRDFPSAILGNRRDVHVYLPPGYARSRARYPVLYLHDGQNCFDAATSFAGVEWGVDETAERLIAQKLIAPLIVVAVDNAKENRIHEYAPTRGRVEPSGDRALRSKGQARKYGRFLAEELKPFIDARYRTRQEAEFTGLGGSSLGGLVTLSLGLWFPKVFTRLAVMSPSVWWDECVIYRMVEGVKRKPPLKIWLDTGTAEPGWERARGLRDRLLAKEWQPGEDFLYCEVEGAGHYEGAWAERIGVVLQFLFPPGLGSRRGSFRR